MVIYIYIYDWGRILNHSSICESYPTEEPAGAECLHSISYPK